MKPSNFLKQFAQESDLLYTDDYKELFEMLDLDFDITPSERNPLVLTNKANDLFQLIVDVSKSKEFFAYINCFLKITVNSENNVTIEEQEGFECKGENNNRLVFIQDYYLLDYSEQRKLISDMIPSEDPLIVKVLPKPLVNTNYTRQKNDKVLFVAELNENNLKKFDYSIGHKIDFWNCLFID